MFPIDRSLRRRAIASALIILLAGCSFIATNAAELFDLESNLIQRGEELGPATIWTLNSAKGKFTFSAPYQWQVRAVPEQKSVIITAPDAASMITVQFTNALPELGPGGNISKLSDAVKKRFRNVKVLEEFTCYSGSGEGKAFDLEVSQDEKVSLVRIAFVPVKDFTLEFVLQCSIDHAETTQRGFGGLMNSFEPAKEAVSSK